MVQLVDTYFDGRKTTYVYVNGGELLYLLKHNDDVIAFNSLQDYMEYDGNDYSKAYWLDNHEFSNITHEFPSIYKLLKQRNESKITFFRR